MKSIPLSLLTLYADLLQGASSEDRPGTISTREIHGRRYLYVTARDGSVRRQRCLGLEDDPEVLEVAERFRRAERRAKGARSVVSALKRARVPAPSLPLGRVLEVIANAGLFQRGAVLVGTAAFQVYSCMVGRYLSSSAISTNDADLLVAGLATREPEESLSSILQRADPSFQPQGRPGDVVSCMFEAENGLRVDVLTRVRRTRGKAVRIPELGCGAIPLKFMEYLVQDPQDAVSLYGRGVLVKVPPPARFAVHKLIVARRRPPGQAPKRVKDLVQAGELIEALRDLDPESIEDALEDARSRGSAWRRAVDASLEEIP